MSLKQFFFGGNMARKKTNVTIVTVAIFIATFMSAIEGTIVSTAMPTIVGDLKGVHLMNWVVSIFLLTNAIFTPIYGKLSDIFGRKKIFNIGILIFLIGSVLSGLSNSMIELIVWRAIQGIGAGCIMPVANTIIADIYPFEKRARVMGLNGAAWGIASIIAPLLGGFIVDNLSWHWVFFINVPIGIITIILIQVYLHENITTEKESIDYFGSMWLMFSLLGLMYGFQLLGESSVPKGPVLISFLVFIISTLMFIRTEKNVKNPIIFLDLFKNRTFIIQNIVTMLVSGLLIGFEIYLPTWMQGVLGLPASYAGFALTPSSIIWILGSFLAGKLIVKHSPKYILNISLTILIIGSLILAIVPYSTPFIAFFFISSILGLGFGITITSTLVVSQKIVEQDRIGVATSFNTLAKSLGQTIMMSIFGIIFNFNINEGLKMHHGLSVKMINQVINPQTAKNIAYDVLPKLREILYSGVHGIYIACFILILIAMAINSFDRNKKVN